MSRPAGREYAILDERAWLDIDSALELEICTERELPGSAANWPGSVVTEIMDDGSYEIRGSTEQFRKE